MRRALLSLTVWVASSALAAQPMFSPGDLDPTFGPGGIVSTSIVESAREIRELADGRILVAAEAHGFELALARYRQDGVLDETFGKRGLVRTHIAGGGGLALGADEKIVVAGGSGAFQIARFLPNGDRDLSFGENGTGMVEIPIGQYGGYASVVAVQEDGKIVAAGDIETGIYTPSHFAFARVMPNGSLDQSFGTGGIVHFQVGGGGGVSDLALDPDGNVVGVGTVWLGWFATSMGIAKLNPDGVVIATGEVNVSGGYDRGEAVVLQNDLSTRKVVAAGLLDNGRGSLIARLLTREDGRMVLDPSFGPDGLGYAETTAVIGASDLKSQADGALVAIGGTADPEYLGMTRFDENGLRDDTFGEFGVVTTHVGAAGTALEVQIDGKILAGGQTSYFGPSDLVLARYFAEPQTLPGIDLEITGMCPGRLQLDILSPVPNSEVALVHGSVAGNRIVPDSQRCGGTKLGIEDARLFGIVRLDERGMRTLTREAGNQVCGVLLQVIDLYTCDTSVVVSLP